MPTVTIDQQGNAIVDGKNLGHFMDADISNTRLHADLKAAFDVWKIGVDQAKQSQDEQFAAAIQDAADRISAANSDRDEKLAAMQAHIDALGGTELAQSLARQKRLSDKAAAIIALQAEIAAIEAEPAAEAVAAAPIEKVAP